MDNSTKRILILEENDALGSVMVDKLKTEGYVTQLVKDGKEGLEKIDTFAPDLILLDMMLPSLNGFEVLEALNKKGGLGSFPPVITLLNAGQHVEVSKILALGVKDYIIKSDFSPEEVLHKVENQLHSSGSSVEGDQLHEEGFRILIVEDDNFLRDLLARKLTHEKYDLLVAANGEEGLELAKNEHPSIILLDLILPGMDGFEVLTAIKADPNTANIPVIILSNLGQESDIDKAKKIGADEFLIKSNFSIDEVVAKMRKLMQEKGGQGAAVAA